MDLSHFSPTNKSGTLQSETLKLLHNVGENTHRKAQETLEFQMT